MPRHETPAKRLAFRVAAVSIVALAGLALAWVHTMPELYAEVVGTALTSAFAVGKFAILYGLNDGSRLGPDGLALLLVTLDLLCAVAILAFSGPAERLPLLGTGMRLLRDKANATLEEYPGLSRMAFLGVTLYVFLPFAATGAVVGSLAARLLGLSRIAGLAAVALGSATVSTAFATLTHLGRDHLEWDDPAVWVPLVLGLGLVGWIVTRQVRRVLRQGPTEGEESPAGTDAATRGDGTGTAPRTGAEPNATAEGD